MRTRITTLMACAVAGLLSTTPTLVRASENHDHQSQSSTNATFGRGLNTARPGNAVNHVVLPTEIKVKAGGVVDFAVAGFHDIVIFKPGFTLADLVQAGGGELPSTPPIFVIPPDPTAALPVNLAHLAPHIYYRGINPAGGPLATPVTGNPANGSNRGEPVWFSDGGVYLVICNIRGHLADGMYAYVKVN